MFSINGSTISLTRGDTLCLNVELYKDDEEYTPASTDIVTFSLKKNFTDNIHLISKSVAPNSENKIVIEITPADTKPLSFGKYKFDMQIKDANERVYTFIVGDFILTEEVT